MSRSPQNSYQIAEQKQNAKWDVPKSEALNQLLQSTTLSDLEDLQNQKLLTFPSLLDLNEAFELLIKNRVLCAPVFDENTKEYIGLLDMKDFITYILALFGKESRPPRELAVFSSQLVDLSRTNPFVPVSEDATLKNTIKQFCDGELHRMPVVSKDDINDVVAMVSQSSIVRWLVKNQEKLGDEFKQGIEDLHVGALKTKKKVIQVTDDEILLDVFQLLHDNKVHGCAIVDKKGKITGNISVSDLQFAIHNNLKFLSAPVKDLFEAMAHERRTPITCSPSVSLLEVMQKLIVADVHRIYVVNDEDQPIGIISFTDILDSVMMLSEGSIASE